MLGDRLDQNRDQAGRQVMAHPGNDPQPRAWNTGRGVPAGLHGHEEIVRAVQHKRRRANPPEHRDPAAGSENGQKVAADPGG